MAKLTMLDFLLRQFYGAPPLDVKADLTGKTVIVVGANTGIGLQASKHFACMNASKVIMACRNESRGAAAVAEIEKATGCKNLELWLLDLTKTASVIQFAERFEKEEGRLDVLLMNAGIAVSEYEEFEGWESSLKVNYLSTALLSLLLLPAMDRTAREHKTKPHLVIVSSEVHFWAKIPDDATKTLESMNKNKTSLSGRYPESKLLEVLFVRALANRLSSTSPIIATTVNPGLCDSELTRSVPFPKSIFFAIFKWLVAWTSEEGSRQLVWAALGPAQDNEEVEEKMRGGYISDNGIREPSDFVLGESGREREVRIWDETIEILSKESPKVPQIVHNFLSNLG
ncbi:hypothetical protein JAAARDRAFT_35543 [Jaapia argillacea MUCL 33604]|uniref:NAD(P)-binding protein n=1 Tax=Jaapia argillacea MUCL 33604 TaxID=933084 RepID=A0A067PVH0_9AGAM|nr:hypothetical protein JAAARDRAFT_35543 [Jaapia argillacea MUCL 33604]